MTTPNNETPGQWLYQYSLTLDKWIVFSRELDEELNPVLWHAEFDKLSDARLCCDAVNAKRGLPVFANSLGRG